MHDTPDASKLLPAGIEMNGKSMVILPINTKLFGGTCSHGTFCVLDTTCNPFTIFIIRNVSIASTTGNYPRIPLKVSGAYESIDT